MKRRRRWRRWNRWRRRRRRRRRKFQVPTGNSSNKTICVDILTLQCFTSSIV
jgi:hypothetical protein